MAKTAESALKSYECRTCGTSVPESRVVAGAAPRVRALEAGLAFCSGGCLSAHTAAVLAGRTCLHCCAKFDPKSGEAGRPAYYCSVRCRREREKVYARALRRLARGEGADPVARGESPADYRRQVAEINEQIGEYEALLVRLQQRRPDGESGRFADDAKLPVSSSVHLIAAVKSAVGRLAEARYQATIGEESKYNEAMRQRELGLWPGLVAAAQAKEQAWRQDLLRITGEE